VLNGLSTPDSRQASKSEQQDSVASHEQRGNGQDRDVATVENHAGNTPSDKSSPVADATRTVAPQVVAAAVKPDVAYEDTQPELPIIREPKTDSVWNETEAEKPETKQEDTDTPKPSASDTPKPAPVEPPKPLETKAPESASSTDAEPEKPQGRLLPWEPQVPSATEKPAETDREPTESAN
jgi:hypothetical protein